VQEKIYQLAGAELEVACQCSQYIAARRAISSIIDLSDWEPLEFDAFLEWVNESKSTSILKACGRARAYSPNKPPGEPWISNGADICLLAIRLKAGDFEKYALSLFISSCALAPFGPWHKIEKRTSGSSPLRRFSNHWVAWNFYLTGCRRNEYTHLQATSLASQVTGRTRDPRSYDIVHWYSDCGDDLQPGCPHDALSRQENLHNNKANETLIDPFQALREMRKERRMIEAVIGEDDWEVEHDSDAEDNNESSWDTESEGDDEEVEDEDEEDEEDEEDDEADPVGHERVQCQQQ
jgi:hypothetical protein